MTSRRPHLLALRFAADVLELPAAAVPPDLGANLDEAMADRLCTLLGHPPAAPDGEPIAPGRCCAQAATGITPIVRRLTEFAKGATLRVTMIDPRVPERSNVLSALGLVPGTPLRLRQTRPAVVVEAGHTTLALDKAVAVAVLAKPAPGEDEVPADVKAIFAGVTG